MSIYVVNGYEVPDGVLDYLDEMGCEPEDFGFFNINNNDSEHWLSGLVITEQYSLTLGQLNSMKISESKVEETRAAMLHTKEVFINAMESQLSTEASLDEDDNDYPDDFNPEMVVELIKMLPTEPELILVHD